jgi:hypothetical protein
LRERGRGQRQRGEGKERTTWQRHDRQTHSKDERAS